MFEQDMMFETDYMVAWDFSNADMPRVTVSRLRSDGKDLVVDVLGYSRAKSGVVSVRQLNDGWERRADHAETE